MQISKGFSDAECNLVADLYWQAFGPKLGRVMRPDDTARAFFARVFDPDYALVARDDSSRLMGAAGFKTLDGALTCGGFADLCATYGLWGAAWRGVLLSVLERDLEPGILLMDGIFVSDEARGKGLGGALLEAISDEARDRGCHAVRLDVTDTNPRARALYERKGFVAKGEEHLGPLRLLFGFRIATRMERAV